MTIDLGRLERRLEAAEGPVVAVTKTVMAELIAAARAGNAATRAKAIETAIAGSIAA